MSTVTISHVFKRFGASRDRAVTAVNDLSLDISDKEFMVLVGPSGCGKTTALRMVAGLEEISDGEIAIDGRVVNDVEPRDRDIAMVFQNYALYPHMTVFENMAFGLRLRRVPKSEIDSRVRQAADQLGLAPLLKRKPGELSGGQRQRVALGRAIVREPKVFLMDEPLSNLDAKLRVQTRAELIKLHRRLGITTIYVTHDQVEAMTMGDRMAVMRDGVLQQCDTPMNVFNSPANMFVAGFVGTPSMNFLPATVTRDDGGYVATLDSDVTSGVPLTDRTALSSYTGKSVTIGIRPGDIVDRRSLNGSGARVATIRTTIDVVEPMGETCTVYLTAGRNQLVATLDTDMVGDAREGNTFDAVVDASKVHVFDTETEQAIR